MRTSQKPTLALPLVKAFPHDEDQRLTKSMRTLRKHRFFLEFCENGSK